MSLPQSVEGNLIARKRIERAPHFAHRDAVNCIEAAGRALREKLVELKPQLHLLEISKIGVNRRS
ncbi:MAG: hypothetical protein ACJAYS_001073 [Lentimonas sp.]|jgi:hypothetical protein